jgi:hypothetical protein
MPLGLAQETTLQLTLQAVDHASTAIRDVERSLASLGSGTTLADVNAQLQSMGRSITSMASTMPTVQDVEAGFLAVESAVHASTVAVGSVEAALHRLGAGVNLAALLNELRRLDTTMSQVEGQVVILTDEVRDGFKQMADAASYGTAAITDAIRVASAEQIEIVRNAMTQMTAATQQGMQKQATAAREGAAHTKGFFDKTLDIGKQMLIWGLAYRVFNDMTNAVGNFGAGLVTVNSSVEQATQTFAALFGSHSAGEQAVEWLDRFAERVPATREEVIQAGMTIASLGDDLTTVMPALSDVAAVMGVQLPRAAQAFADAQMGRFEMLQMSLHITKDDLVKYGMQVDATGHVLNDSFVPAFKELAKVRFGPDSPLGQSGSQAQMDTFAGKISNVADAITRLQEELGKGLHKNGVFNVLKQQLDGLIAALSSKEFQHMAEVIGTGLGVGMGAAINAVKTAVKFIVAVWQSAEPTIRTAAHMITEAMGTIGTFLQQKVLPVVLQVIGQMVQWWDNHKEQIGVILNTVITVVMTFVGTLQSNLAAGLHVLHGVWEISWALISGSLGAVIDLMTGNWKKFGEDLNNMATGIAIGILEVLRGLVDKTIEIISHMADPINNLEHALYDATKPFADELYNLGTIVEVTWDRMYNKVVGIIDKLGDNKLVKALAATGNPLAQALQAVSGMLHPVALPTRQEIEAGRTTAEGIYTLGFRPDVNLTFGATQQQAQAQFDAQVELYEKQIRESPNLFTGAPSTYGTPTSHQAAGKSFMERFNEWMRAHRLDFTSVTKDGDSGTAPAGTGGASTDFRSAGRDIAHAVTEAHTRFQLFLSRGAPGGMAVGLQDIRDIARADAAAKKSRDEIALDVLQSTKQLIDTLLGQAKNQFDLDKAHHASQATLQRDENNYLAILAKTPGITPQQIAIERARLDAERKGDPQATLNAAKQTLDDMRTLHMSQNALVGQINVIMRDYGALGVKPGSLHYQALHQQLLDEVTGGAAGYTRPAEPRYMPYGGLGRQPGFGGVEVMFGGPQADPTSRIVAELRYQNEHLREQVKHLQALLYPMQQTASNTGQTARNTSGHTMGHEGTYPTPPQPSTAAMRRGGGMVPVPV